ncbi:unnamed protein product [Meloidogyne enterolobii]|uniref:Uncharacterized protein n=1 Tax=Meloidogyne enterolobii TaxID=390850 RepID=A0ACB0YJK8_MELEN
MFYFHFIFFNLLAFNSVFCLNIYLDTYEQLSYKPVQFRRSRELNSHSTTDVKFRSHTYNRTFHLKLQPLIFNKNVFDDSHIIDVDGIYHSNVIRPSDFIYEGYLDGDPNSLVYGTMLDGIFDGYITTGDGKTFTVEKANRYFDVGQRPIHFHSIVYADEHITHNRFIKKDPNNGAHYSCALTKKLHQDMRKFQQSAIVDDDYILTENNLNNLTILDLEFERMHNSFNQRTKRSIKTDWKDVGGRRVYEARTCTIYLQADHKLYEHIYNKEGNGDHIRTREEIVALLYTHIKAVNQIYESTNFNGIHGINFAIKRTTIYTPSTCKGERAATTGNPFCEENVDVSNYLNMNSQKDHSAFCLAYSLTYRDFIGGTLGLAWVASPSQSTAGGICQKYQRYNEHQRGGVSRSLNTGIITLVNYGNRVPPRVSQLTLAHEIGHNFGSPHDFPLECQPGLPDGNFIMFASATSGDKPNNSKFSQCSIANISEVLFEVLGQSPKAFTLGRKKNCFTDQLKSFCGNQIKEDDEQCDCGFTALDCQEMGDRCCTPREGATEKPGKLCSPSEGLCCNPDNCSFYAGGDRRPCREDSECQHRQFCDGSRASCPPSNHKPNGKPCQDSTKVCHQGSCNGSLCAHYNLRDCFLTEGRPEDLCQLACEKNGVCLPSVSLPELALANLSQEGRSAGFLLLPPGSPCNNYLGYCDIFRKCRSVDSNGPLARLKNLLFNREAIKEFTQLVKVFLLLIFLIYQLKENWWGCVFVGIVVLMFMALFVKCCAVHTPSTNPNKLPPANFSDTLRHPGTLLRRGHGGVPNNRPAVSHNRPVPQRNERERPSRSTNNHSRSAPTNSRGDLVPRSVVAVPEVANVTSRSSALVAETPLIQSNSIAVPPADPPPPYELTDPTPSISAQVPISTNQTASPSSTQPVNSLEGCSIINQCEPLPIRLPTAPPPVLTTGCSVLPLIPGPPINSDSQCGPRPGRRKPKPLPQQIKQRKKESVPLSNDKRYKRQAK